MIKNTLNNLISPILERNKIDISKISFISDFKIELSEHDKNVILQKLLEAHELALANVHAGNITGRGFATAVCTIDGFWSIGTNFNNTRNDISSVCGERSAVLCAYNEALLRYANNPVGKFDFKIKYMCMAQSLGFDEMKKTSVPCEDCLSWLNTNRYFNKDTLIFAFEKNLQDGLFIKITKLIELLPYYDLITTNEYIENKKIKYTALANEIVQKSYSEKSIYNLLKLTYECYKNNLNSEISSQNIAASIETDNKIYSFSKCDWTRRWNVEPLEAACFNAINSENNVTIKVICYFGDEYSKTSGYFDKVVSIKSLGRTRQKYADNNTLMILNTKENILVLTLGEFLPKKFQQGYKIK